MLTDVHHDGSPLYVSTAQPELGDTVQVRLRTRADRQPAVVVVRVIHDGEPTFVPAVAEAPVANEIWWSAELEVRNPVTHYRWLLADGDFRYQWLTAAGLVDHDVPDADDFVISTFPNAPAWGRSAVVYQVYPDRFARGSSTEQLGAPVRAARGAEIPEWALPREWTQHPDGRAPVASAEYFGGDLDGVREHFDHIQGLGATVVYLTPVFPARSTHRYDATTFDAIDPLLGGDAALADLNREAHRRGMRTLGDITLNHSGVTHEWFERAAAGEHPQREYYRFDAAQKHGYHCWMGVRTLPKFDLSNDRLRDALISVPDAPIRHWLGGSDGFDGWRVDVANMAGRLGDVDVTHDVAREVRAAIALEKPDALLVAEHGHDAGPDLLGDGWHGTMNYAGFTRPLWCWLRAAEFTGTFMGLPIQVPTFTGRQFVDTVSAFHGSLAWRSALASWNILSSHDSPRIRTVVGSRERQIAALGLSIGLPGVPMVFAGDEIGETGDWGEDSRTPFPWQDADAWDAELLEAYRVLLSLRAESIALGEGGLRWIHVDDDALVFAREHPRQSMLIAVARNALGDVRIDATRAGVTTLQHRFGFSAHSDGEHIRLQIPHAGAGVWLMS